MQFRCVIWLLLSVAVLCTRRESLSHFRLRTKWQQVHSPTNEPIAATTPLVSTGLDIGGKCNARKIVLTIPAILLLLLSTSRVDASPMNKQRVQIVGPFFQGWLVRTVDHERNTSFIIIAGSFSRSGTSAYTQHYMFCGVNSPQLSQHEEALLSPADVSITGGPPPHFIPRLNVQPLETLWDAGAYGWLKFTEDTCVGSVHLNGLHVEFNTSSRVPWRPPRISPHPNVPKQLPERLDNVEGPEGWLGATTLLLPCHYFVHSVGSKSTYKITSTAYPRDEQHTPRTASLWTSLIRKTLHTSTSVNLGSLGNCSEAVRARRKAVTLRGTGYTHVEGNHGRFFPSGWIWSQGVATNNTASFSMVLGKFTIAGFTPTTCVFYLRRRNGKVLVFRTTDLDLVRFTTDRTTGDLQLSARSLWKRQRVEVTIQTSGSTTQAFDAHVQVPTACGFSNSPGCVETYTATATIRVIDADGAEPADAPEEYVFPLTALEYGGAFIAQRLDR